MTHASRLDRLERLAAEAREQEPTPEPCPFVDPPIAAWERRRLMEILAEGFESMEAFFASIECHPSFGIEAADKFRADWAEVEAEPMPEGVA